jgi:hypothetical protein
VTNSKDTAKRQRLRCTARETLGTCDEELAMWATPFEIMDAGQLGGDILCERKLRAALSSLLAVSPESFQDWKELPGKPDSAVAFW